MSVADVGPEPQNHGPKWHEIRQKAEELDAQGVPRSVIATRLGVHRTTVQRQLGPKKKKGAK